MFSAMQAALASAHHTLDENKGLLGKIKLLGAAFVGAATLAVAIVVFVSLNTDKDLGQCESATDTQCLVYQVGDGKCDWGCNVAQCKFDKGDCKYYTDACKNAWLQNTMGNRPEFTGEILSCQRYHGVLF
jgi:LNR domain.